MNYHNITYPDMLNGSGLRVVLWLSGCDHKCKGCQNIQTWDCNSGIPFDKKTKEELFRELNKDYISGITFTGGDPLHKNNLDEVLNLINELRVLLPQKSIWLYTGYTVDIYELYNCDHLIIETSPNTHNDNDFKREEIVRKCDVVVDGRYIDSQRDVSLKWRGSSNQRVIDVKKSLEQKKVVLYCD